jgi:hypothetical protein
MIVWDQRYVNRQALPSWAFETHLHLPDLFAGGSRFVAFNLWRGVLHTKHTFVECVQRCEDDVLLAKDLRLDEPWKPGADVILDMSACRNGEDVVQFFERTLFGLWDKQEDHDKGENVQCTISIMS